MTRIDFIRRFALDERYGVTGPLTHNEVKLLASHWLPELLFHEEERFHPIAFRDLLHLARDMPSAADWLDGQDPASPTVPALQWPPPVIFQNRDHRFVLSGFEDDRIDQDSFVSNLRDLDYDRAKQFFGSNTVVSEANLPRFQVTAIAEFRMLREELRHNLLAYLKYPDDFRYERTSGSVPVLDAIRGEPLLGSCPKEWEQILKLLDLHESRQHEEERRVLKDLAEIVPAADWLIITKFAFLEYYLLYEYNDFVAHESFGNEHEGDVEGVCLAFARERIEAIELAADRDHYIKESVWPDFFMTSAHGSSVGLDEIRDFRGSSAAEIREDLRAWVALGSHATYLSGVASHDTTSVEEHHVAGGAAAVSVLFPPLLPAVIILALILEHFLTEDDTSDDGAHAAPPSAPVPTSPRAVVSEVETTPLSQDKNLYVHSFTESGDSGATLAQRAFPGRWGGHYNDSIIDPFGNAFLDPFAEHDQSPRWSNKTVRFIKRMRAMA
jgi:hypothetical protein